MKSFTRDGLDYRPVQKVNGGTQWRCDYPDGQWAAAMVYKARPTRQDVVDAINDVNDRSSNNQDNN